MSVVPESQLTAEIAAELVALAGVTDLRDAGPADQMAGALGRRFFAEQMVAQANRNGAYYGLATGANFDDLLYDVLPDGLTRLPGTRATGTVVFVASDPASPITIPVGTPVVRSSDSARYVTTEEGTITAGSGQRYSGSINCISLYTGTAYNVDAIGDIDTMGTGIDSIATNGVSNNVPFTNGTDMELDDQVLDRLRAYVRTLSAGTPTSIEQAIKAINDSTYGSPKFVKMGDSDGTGRVRVYLDDGYGTYAGQKTTRASGEVLLASAAGNETVLYLANRPVVSLPTVYVDGTPTAYTGTRAWGKVKFATALAEGVEVTAGEYEYRYGMISLAQKVIDGWIADPTNYPGYGAYGNCVEAWPASLHGGTFIDVSASIVMDDVTLIATVLDSLKSIVANTINALDIGATGYRAAVVAALMAHPNVRNVTNVRFNGDAVDLYPGEGVVLRTRAANITLT